MGNAVIETPEDPLTLPSPAIRMGARRRGALELSPKGSLAPLPILRELGEGSF